MRRSFVFGIALLSLAGACGGSGSADIKPGPMPDNGTFSGVYFSPQYGEMHLVQNGSAVVGKYKQDEREGQIQGEANGNLLRFEWTEYKAMVSNRPQITRGHGYFRYMVDAGNGDHLLKGRWGLNDDDTAGGDWNAYKSKSREPDLEHFATDIPTGGGESTGKGSEGESNSSTDSNSSGSGSGNEGGGNEGGGDDIF
jgi:hypothetical protein